MFIRTFILFVFILITPLFADEDFKLDPAPKSIRKVIETDSLLKLEFPLFDGANVRNDLALAIANQTSVKSQGRRGTCSIFSATAEIESLLKSRLGKDFDLSENYMEFLIMTRIKSTATEGSDTSWNIPAVQKYGTIYETDWPYEIYSWENLSDLPSDEAKRAETVCGSFTGNKKMGCLLSHLDPEDTRYDKKASELRSELDLSKLENRAVYNQEKIKAFLDNGQPLVLGIEFFYGSWNHRKMEEYKIGTRDFAAWEKGTVSTPTENDIKLSREHGAGHSIVVVGYDDEKKVYYFKNSWGADSFGVKSDFLSTSGSTKGYGTITYEYAHNYGEFQYVGFSKR